MIDNTVHYTAPDKLRAVCGSHSQTGTTITKKASEVTCVRCIRIMHGAAQVITIARYRSSGEEVNL